MALLSGIEGQIKKEWSEAQGRAQEYGPWMAYIPLRGMKAYLDKWGKEAGNVPFPYEDVLGTSEAKITEFWQGAREAYAARFWHGTHEDLNLFKKSGDIRYLESSIECINIISNASKEWEEASGGKPFPYEKAIGVSKKEIDEFCLNAWEGVCKSHLSKALGALFRMVPAQVLDGGSSIWLLARTDEKTAETLIDFIVPDRADARVSYDTTHHIVGRLFSIEKPPAGYRHFLLTNHALEKDPSKEGPLTHMRRLRSDIEKWEKLASSPFPYERVLGKSEQKLTQLEQIVREYEVAKLVNNARELYNNNDSISASTALARYEGAQWVLGEWEKQAKAEFPYNKVLEMTPDEFTELGQKTRNQYEAWKRLAAQNAAAAQKHDRRP